MDVWIGINQANAQRLVEALRAFGFGVPDLSPSLFLRENLIMLF